MVTKQLSIAIAISICLGSGMARSDLKTFAAAPGSEMKIDFDQVFAGATWQGEFDPSIHDGLRHVGRNFITKTTEQQNTVPNLLRHSVPVARLRKAITPGQFSITIVGPTLPPRSVSRSLRLRSRKVGGWLRGCGHCSTGDPIAGLLSVDVSGISGSQAIHPVPLPR
jgi:hypothetical protein